MKKNWFLRSLLIGLVVVGTVTALPLSTAGCGTPSTIVTEPGKQAYATNEVLIRVEELQDAAVAAFDKGQLDLATSRAIVFATVQINDLAEAKQAGWQAVALKAWANAKEQVPALRQGGQFALIAAAIDEALKTR